jgi:hypothetical protein
LRDQYLADAQPLTKVLACSIAEIAAIDRALS